MKKIFNHAIANPKTTFTGIIIAIANYIVFEETIADRPLYYKIASFLISGGFAYLGICNKDIGKS